MAYILNITIELDQDQTYAEMLAEASDALIKLDDYEVTGFTVVDYDSPAPKWVEDPT